MKHITRISLAMLLAVALVPLGSSVATSAQSDGQETAVRLAFVDFETNVVSVLDAESGDATGSFGMPGPGSVYGSSGGRWFYVVHTAQNRVSVIDSGLSVEDHGDHQDLEIGSPYVRGTIVTGRRPIDTWVQNGMATFHNDDDGTLAVLDDERLEVALDYTEIRGAGTGHNNGLVLGDHVLLSLASAGTVTEYRMDGTVVQTFEGCPGTHGWAIAGATAAAGCTDGVMLFTLANGRITMQKIDNPAGTPMGTRVGTIRANPNSPVMIGNWGAGLAIIRPETGGLQPVELSAAPLAFFFTPDGSRLIVLMPDGAVQALDPATGRALGSVAAVAPYPAAAMGQPANPRPNLVVGNGVAYVTNPPAGEIVEVNTNTMAVSRRMNVGGTPTSIGMVSASGVVHEE